jgi:hypothetical protein
MTTTGSALIRWTDMSDESAEKVAERFEMEIRVLMESVASLFF